MKPLRTRLIGAVVAVFSIGILSGAGAQQGSGMYALQYPNLVRNGSFENKKSTWVNTSCNYMALVAGSNAIPRWIVTPDTVNEIVWAMTPTCDGFTAGAGNLFLDLTGFGGDSPNGGVQQSLKTVSVGQQYSVSLAVVGTVPLVTVDQVAVALTPGPTFKKGSTVWTYQNGTFIAASSNPVLRIQNPQPGAQIAFVDKVAVRAQ